MSKSKQNRNFMDEMHDIICEIDSLKPEPETCNVNCPPLGCPLGPCPGMCCSKGICDPCCVSRMPCDPSLPYPPRCMPKCFKGYAYSPVCLPSCDSSLIIINGGGATIRNGCYSNSIFCNSKFQALPSCNLMTALPCYTVGSTLCWNS